MLQAFCHGRTRPAFCHGRTRPACGHGRTRPAFCRGRTRPAFCRGRTRPVFCRGRTRPACGRGHILPYCNCRNLPCPGCFSCRFYPLSFCRILISGPVYGLRTCGFPTSIRHPRSGAFFSARGHGGNRRRSPLRSLRRRGNHRNGRQTGHIRATSIPANR